MGPRFRSATSSPSDRSHFSESPTRTDEGARITSALSALANTGDSGRSIAPDSTHARSIAPRSSAAARTTACRERAYRSATAAGSIPRRIARSAIRRPRPSSGPALGSLLVIIRSCFLSSCRTASWLRSNRRTVAPRSG
jgi:hypothetical protein